jgi:hypothetical protein
MDCHENNSTTWKLMGVFKEASYFGNDAFFEQLFKHEGVCVWNNADLYSFMSTARKNYWPTGCVSTGIKITNTYSNGYGSYLYIDLRPTWNGNMTYGLYSDEICKTEYDLPDKDIDSITKSMGLLYGSYLQKWNDGLEAFKVCQPCKAYNLKNNYASSNYYGSYSDTSDPNAGYFQCYDDADYTNVNQCMKFRSHAQLEVCTWEDLVTATNQGGILEVKVGDTIFGSERMTAEEYKYLMKAQKESNLKASKAEAQTVAMYRKESEKVASMKVVADCWNVLGGLTLAMGTVFLFGAVFWVGKGYIDRAMPKTTLGLPLLPPSRDFLGKEMGDTTTNQPSIPFGNGSDEESVVNRADLLDENSSVSSLSYTSTMQDPTKSDAANFVPDALDAWYTKVDDDSAKNTSPPTESNIKLNEMVSPTKSEEQSVMSSIFDGVQASNDGHNIHRSHPIGDYSRDDDTTLDSSCVYLEHQEIPAGNNDSSADSIIAVESTPEEALEEKTPETDEVKTNLLADASENIQDSLFSIDDSEVVPTPDAQDEKATEVDEVHSETTEIEKTNVSVSLQNVSDSLFTIDDLDAPAFGKAHNEEEVVYNEDLLDTAVDSQIRSSLVDGEVRGENAEEVEEKNEQDEDKEEADDKEEHDANVLTIPETLDSMETESKSDDQQDGVTADAETARISNVSMIDTLGNDRDMPNEMMRYLSMSASEQSNVDEGSDQQNIASEDRTTETNEERVDDQTEQPSSM